MFSRFFLSPHWRWWAWGGSALIALVTAGKVQLDVRINAWFGTFYNQVQEALTTPGAITFEQFLGTMLQFASIALIYIGLAVFLEFFIRHYVFRWRTALNDGYIRQWAEIHAIEGAAQRVQEDTMRFAHIMQGLGVNLLQSLLTLLAFLPILWQLSAHVKTLPWVGDVPHALVFVALFSAILGTSALALAGIKLPGLEFDNQKVEAAYRKALVYAEDTPQSLSPTQADTYFQAVRGNYFRLFFHYLYFDVVKWSYLQASVVIPYIALGPTIVTAGITLGVMQQIVRAFQRVEYSFQYLVHSWSTIVELISIYKRLKAFERHIAAKRASREVVSPTPL